eukprot:4932166-Alexandrium_andersonii.AAC.1
MSASLVGSEMCIRDRCRSGCRRSNRAASGARPLNTGASDVCRFRSAETVSYTHLTLPTICSV